MGFNREGEDYLSGRETPDRQETDDDDDWVDYEEEEVPRSSEKAPARPTSPDNTTFRTSPRKRGTRKPIYIVNGSRKQTTTQFSQKPVPNENSAQIREAVVKGIWDGTTFASRYALDVSSTAIHMLRWPISMFLFFWLLTFMLGYISNTLRHAVQPLCIIPGFSSSSICRPWDSNPVPSGNLTPKWADYSKLVDVQSQSFEQLLEGSAGGSALSLEVKKAEMATTDLVARIRVSDLKAKDTLATSLTEFVGDAKKTGRSLQKLTSKVGGAVDNIMAVNDYALQSIESARATEPSAWSLTGLLPWKSPRKSVNEVVTQTFDEAMNVLSVNMERLILEAEDNLHNLNELEERLATLQEILAREDSSISSAKSDLLEDLWTKFGGNRKSLRNFDHHLTLLKGLGTYRKQALVHVVAALQTLHAMSEDMEDMRERVAAPDLIGLNVPAEVHMKSIRMGLDRLREGRIKAKKLQEDAVRRVISIDGSEDD
ncbi:hypothetical protein BDZ97DRAFT_1667049 [Flammula alnicola]|nr:hypothetical protein BDZ97DRAFT_1667049 [Flammula alnicola]